MVRVHSPAAQAKESSLIRALPGKLFAQPWSRRCHEDSRRLLSALSWSSAPAARFALTWWRKTAASVVWPAAGQVSAELPVRIPCRACDRPRRARALRSSKDQLRLVLSDRANGLEWPPPSSRRAAGQRFSI